MAILVYIEQASGKIKKTSLEAVSYAFALAQKTGEGAVIALALGTVEEQELAAVGEAGASKVLHSTDERLNAGVIQAHATAVAQAFHAVGASTLILAKSSLGDAVAARLAIKLEAGLVSNVVELPRLESGFMVKRSIYTGKAFADTTMTTPKKILAIKKNAVAQKVDGAKAPVEVFVLTLPDTDFASKITATERIIGEVLLPEADVVVSGGRGMKGPENWGIIEDLAQTLGAATGEIFTAPLTSIELSKARTTSALSRGCVTTTLRAPATTSLMDTRCSAQLCNIAVRTTAASPATKPSTMVASGPYAITRGDESLAATKSPGTRHNPGIGTRCSHCTQQLGSARCVAMYADSFGVHCE